MSANYFGCYRGICTTNADPENRKRIKAKVPQLLGPNETDWAWPCLPPGWSDGLLQNHVFTDNDTGVDAGGSSTETLVHALKQAVPKPGQGVWVMFEGGDITKPVWIGVST